MNDEEQELQEQEEQKAYAEFLGQDPEKKTDAQITDDDPQKTTGDDPKEKKGLEFYEILYDHDNDTYTMSKETFNHIKGIE